jgi:hypothetical protein
MSNVIKLKRTYKPNVTLGTFEYEDGTKICTVELPDKNNAPMISCIPEGTYVLKKRASPMVSRTSKGKYTIGWEVTGVKGRSYIMIHIGNTVKDFNGCIGVGTTHGRVNGAEGVLNSAVAFTKFMTKMEEHETWTLVITKG